MRACGGEIFIRFSGKKRSDRKDEIKVRCKFNIYMHALHPFLGNIFA